MQSVQIVGLSVEGFFDRIRAILREEKATEKAEESTRNHAKELLTRPEVAELLAVSLVTLHTWEKKGVLLPVKVEGSNRILYRRDDVMNALKSKNKR